MDPAMGMSGMLTAIQSQPQLSSSGGGQGGGDLNSAADNLSRAARSLEGVQGNIAGQSMAIGQMTMASQQSSSSITATMSQLSAQISSLSQAVARLSGGVQMSAAMSSVPPPPMPQPMMPPPPSPMMGGGASGAMGMLGAGAMAGGRAYIGGAHAFGGAMGRIGAGGISPFTGSPVMGAGPGNLLPQIPNQGFMKNIGLASGVGVHPSMMQQAHAGDIMQLGRERMGQGVANTALATMGGTGQMLSSGLGEYAGFGMASQMGLRGAAGLVGGSVIGMGLAAVPGAMIDEGMRQVGGIRGSGQQLNRNAFRFMGPGQLRGPGRRLAPQQQQKFGEAMNRMSIEDLSFSDNDMTEMFAGAAQGDMLRGVGNTEEVVNRMRSLKESIKTMGRNLKMGVAEASGTLSEMQSIGFDINRPGTSRAAIFGASSIPGMTQKEGMRSSLAFGQQYAGMGIGAQATGVGAFSAAAGQSAIQKGRLGAADIAAVGGREGAQQVLGTAAMGYMQSSMGMATMLAGNQGMGVRGTVGAASRGASGNIGTAFELMNDPSRLQREMTNNPEQMIAGILPKAREVANQLPDSIPMRERMKMAIGELTGTPAGPRRETLMKTIEGMGEGAKDRNRQGAMNLQQDMKSRSIEESSHLAKIGRAFSRGMAPGAEKMAGIGASIETSINKTSDRLSKSFYGIESTVMAASSFTPEAIEAATKGQRGDLLSISDEQFEKESRALEKTPVAAGMSPDTRGAVVGGREADKRTLQRKNALRVYKMMNRKENAPGPGQKKAARKYLDKAMVTKRRELDKLAQEIKDTENPEARADAAKKMMDIIRDGSGLSELDPTVPHQAKMLKAINDELMNQYGVDPMGAQTRSRDYQQGFSKKDIREAEEQIRGITDEIGGTTDEDVMNVMSNPDFAKYVEALETGDPAKVNELYTKITDVSGGEHILNEIASKPEMLGKIKKATGTQAKIATHKGIQAAGSTAAEALKGIASGRELNALRKGSSRAIVDTLGGLDLSPEKMAELRERAKTDGTAKKILEGLTDQSVDAEERGAKLTSTLAGGMAGGVAVTTKDGRIKASEAEMMSKLGQQIHDTNMLIKTMQENLGMGPGLGSKAWSYLKDKVDG